MRSDLSGEAIVLEMLHSDSEDDKDEVEGEVKGDKESEGLLGADRFESEKEGAADGEEGGEDGVMVTMDGGGGDRGDRGETRDDGWFEGKEDPGNEIETSGSEARVSG